VLANTIWVVPNNDGEAVEIIRLLQAHSQPVLVTSQPWGASWAKLEPAIQEQLHAAAGKRILGVELAGPNPYGAIDIDHHRYADQDRAHPLSSLEQVAQLLGVQLDRWQHLVAVNDRAYFPGLESANATPAEVAQVRRHDLEAQGLGPDHRRQAESDIAAATWIGRSAIVACPNGSNSWHSDLLYPRADQWLLIGPDEWNYSGPNHRALAAFNLGATTWSGGSPERGYFGIANPSAEAQSEILRLFRAWLGQQ
jgi:hypothetical protein